MKKILCLLFLCLAACAETQDAYEAYANSDYETAKKKLQPLSDQGDLKAMTYLGAIEQIEKNYSEAIKLYTAAAKRNYAPAQYNLGIMLHEGNHIEKNLSAAYAWFYLAKQQGLHTADQQMENMANTITPNQIMQAKKWAEDQLIKE